MFKRFAMLALATLAVLSIVWESCRSVVSVALADEPPPAQKEVGEAKADPAPTVWTTAVPPKALSDHVAKGLAWLVEHQHPNGGWSQGEEAATMHPGGGKQFTDTPNVADTCIAALALLRAGHTPESGTYKEAVARAVKYVRSQVDASAPDSLDVSDVKGTRVQMKLGPNIDTFLASLFLAEVKGRMRDEQANREVNQSLDKVLAKIKKHQKADGTWDNATGWAPILAQSVGGKGLNRAAQAGANVPAEVLAKTESFAVAQSNAASAKPATAAAPPVETVALLESAPGETAGTRTAGRAKVSGMSRAGGMGMAGMMGGGRGFAMDGAAGVELYARASNLSTLQDSVNTNEAAEAKFRMMYDTAKNDKDRSFAKRGLDRVENTRKAHQESQKALLGRLDDAGFVAGFGSNGGEEFLSYMNISESLVLKGGHDWKRWDDAMASNLDRIQNQDGSWSGHHCITGKTFCTSTALLVLMADRTPVPVKAKPAAETKAPVH